MKKISYSEAIAEVEDILQKIDSEKLDVDQLAGNVKRATELIAMCREKLRKAEDEVAQALKED